MITTTIRTFIETTKSLLRDTLALAIFAGAYALLLATLYGFIATREATVWQVLLTLSFLVLIPAEFFILQAAIVDHARDRKFEWRHILLDSCKLFVVTIPVIVLGYALFTWLNKWQLQFPIPKPAEILTAAGSAAPNPPPLHWPTLLFATLRVVLFGIALPLLTIHLWIEVAGKEVCALVTGGAKNILRRVGNVLARAFASDSVFTYALGLIVFAAIPYALLFVHVTIKGNKADFTVFIARLVVVFAFTLFGWLITLSALISIAGRSTGATDATKTASSEITSGRIAEPVTREAEASVL